MVRRPPSGLKIWLWLWSLQRGASMLGQVFWQPWFHFDLDLLLPFFYLFFFFLHSLCVGSVWVNCHSVMDPALPLCGRRESGNCTDGGREVYYKNGHMFSFICWKWDSVLSTLLFLFLLGFLLYFKLDVWSWLVTRWECLTCFLFLCRVCISSFGRHIHPPSLAPVPALSTMLILALHLPNSWYLKDLILPGGCVVAYSSMVNCKMHIGLVS